MRLLHCMFTSVVQKCFSDRKCAFKVFNHIRRELSSKSYDINLVINGVNLNKYITTLENEYEAIKTRTDSRERLRYLRPIINLLEKRKIIIDNITSLNELIKDKDADIRAMAFEEKKSFESKIKVIDSDVEEALLNIDCEEGCNGIILEVSAGVGGQEAMLFAKELFDMYCNFLVFKGWGYEIAEYLTTDLGGIRHGSVLINSSNAFRYFKHEAGVHRVQRIPATEKAGRVHTSTVSVVALPQPTDIEIDLQMKDLRIETKRASGAGGQHVNTTDSAVRITHLPTGIAVECQVDRSQIKNKAIALQRIRAKLYQLKLEAQVNEVETTKKSQVRSNFRNEKIRTYNFNQDRISDHRIQSYNIHNLKGFMQGKEQLENLINKLDYNSKITNLLRNVTELDNK